MTRARALGMRWPALAALVIAGALASPPIAANAAAVRPDVPIATSTGPGGGGGNGRGSGSPINSSAASPAQQITFGINGHHTFQAGACDQGFALCNVQQGAGVRYWP
ncbi:hypothetical protein [Sphaerimonospora thailandensis]|uniref:hypothetical protein n=1 Tax=Sphaerimonospora thailandensis TaxID=795644 RepID=UPI0019522074|nr:hypothetical protein [Sphaerimonospora thailandensis]